MNDNGQANWTIADYAQWYAAFGWPPVPIWKAPNGICCCHKREKCKDPGKHPRTRHGFLDATTDEKRFRTWKWETANIGIRTGAPSGLVVLDVDRRNGVDGVVTLNELNCKLGRLPACPMEVTGGNGLHLFFQYPGWPVPSVDQHAPNVDIKGDGGFVVVAPSIHESGNRYAWEVPPDKVGVPTLPESWLQWLPKGSTERPEAQESTEAQEAQEAQESSPGVSEKVDVAPSEMIQATLPEGPGHRWKKQWELARRLRALPDLADSRLTDIFTQWWILAAPKTSGTHSYEEALGEFVNAYHSVRFPWGVNTVTTLLEKAKTAKPPKAVAEFPTPEFRTLAALCRELQHEAGPEQPFFLSSHQAAELLGKHPKVVWQWLKLLCHLGVLDLVRTGDRKRASEYRYVGGD